LITVAASGAHGSTGFLAGPNSLVTEISMVQMKRQKIVLQHNDLWFDVKMHCAKSCRPFELFANENHELQNEAEMNVTFERGSAQDPSAQSSLCCVERCFWVKNRRASCAVCCDFACNDSIMVKLKVMFWMWRSKDAAVVVCRAASADDGLLLF